MQRPVDLFLPLLAQKRLQRQQQRFLPFVHFSRLPQHCGGRFRQRLLLKNGLHRLRLRFRGVRHGTPEPEEKTMGLMDHLNELRWRLVRCFIAAGVGFLLCWTVVEPIFNFITAPLLSALPAHGTAMYTTLPEPFFVRMFVAFVTGLFVTSPYIFYQIWAFISPGLYEEEKKGLLPIALLSAIFFIGGGVFCYFIVFPYAFNFFLGFSSEQIQAMPRITDYLDFVIKLLLAFGLIFEMPLFSFFLSRMGLITAQMMRKVRRYAVLCIFIVAAILTPPDVVSQLLMAMPMLLLYEISILVAAAFGRKKKEKKEEEEAALDREKRMQEAMLSIKKKFGKNAVLKGMNLQEGATARDRNEQIGGHKA